MAVIALTEDGQIWHWGNMNETYLRYRGLENEQANEEMLSERNIQMAPVYVTSMKNWPIFSDVPLTHWGHDSIKWAAENSIVEGVGGGRFNPEGLFTEAAFATILARVFKLDVQDGSGHWSQGSYDALAAFALPLQGYESDRIKDQPVTRGMVAKVLAASQGQPSDLELAISWMFEEGLTSGKYKTGHMMSDYAPDEILKRAEATEFMKNLIDQGITSIVE